MASLWCNMNLEAPKDITSDKCHLQSYMSQRYYSTARGFTGHDINLNVSHKKAHEVPLSTLFMLSGSNPLRQRSFIK